MGEEVAEQVAEGGEDILDALEALEGRTRPWLAAAP
jgi:hypothetical protein